MRLSWDSLSVGYNASGHPCSQKGDPPTGARNSVLPPFSVATPAGAPLSFLGTLVNAIFFFFAEQERSFLFFGDREPPAFRGLQLLRRGRRVSPSPQAFMSPATSVFCFLIRFEYPPKTLGAPFRRLDFLSSFVASSKDGSAVSSSREIEMPFSVPASA